MLVNGLQDTQFSQVGFKAYVHVSLTILKRYLKNSFYGWIDYKSQGKFYLPLISQITQNAL